MYACKVTYGGEPIVWFVVVAAMRCHYSMIAVAALVAWIGIASALPEDSESGCTSAACIWARLRERGLVRDTSVAATRRAEGGYGAGQPRQYYAYYERPEYRQPAANYQSSGKTHSGSKSV